jgi:hypothetical protein
MTRIVYYSNRGDQIDELHELARLLANLSYEWGIAFLLSAHGVFL